MFAGTRLNMCERRVIDWPSDSVTIRQLHVSIGGARVASGANARV